MPEKFEKAPAVRRTIKQIKSEDTRVRILGVVVKKEKESSSIVLNDGEESIVVILPEDSLFDKTNVGDMKIVIGTSLPYEGGIEIKAEAIQDAKGIDKNLYMQIYSMLV